jgi:hypothetical protein
MELAIDIVKSLVGRDFMSYPNVLEDFKSQIKKVADGLVDNPYYYIESKYAAELDLQNEDNSIGSICLDNAEIFVVNSDDKPSLPEFTIRTYDINDSNLQNLLTHNFEGIYEWMEQIVDRLKAIKK